jgi:hypothetical protein
MNTDIETLEGAGTSSIEFQQRVDNLQTKLIDICDDESHGGVVVCALVNTLSIQLYQMCTANGVDPTDLAEQIRKDLLTNILELEKEFGNVPEVLAS